MNGLHTEYSNLTPYHINWLDGCGATWNSRGVKFSNLPQIFCPFIEFLIPQKTFVQTGSPEHDSTHCPTGDAFCQGIAKILGIEYVPEKVADAKPVAIVYSLLDKKEINWLKNNIGIENDGVPMQFFNCVFLSGDAKEGWQIIFQNGSTLSVLGYTITESRTEFFKYVAQQTGKEYKEREETVDEAIERFGLPVQESYPHKTYRILDSLDEIPLDTRFKLRDQVPTPRKKVLLIFGEKFFEGWVQYVDEFGFRIGSDSKDYFSVEDGHWMRIV